MLTNPILSPAKVKKCKEWLAAHNIHACPLCSSKPLSVRDVICAPVVETETQTPQKHNVHVLAVECDRCLHVLFFDAVKLGLMGKD